jgi:hypothetical protein
MVGILGDSHGRAPDSHHHSLQYYPSDILGQGISCHSCSRSPGTTKRSVGDVLATITDGTCVEIVSPPSGVLVMHCRLSASLVQVMKQRWVDASRQALVGPVSRQLQEGTQENTAEAVQIVL